MDNLCHVNFVFTNVNALLLKFSEIVFVSNGCCDFGSTQNCGNSSIYYAKECMGTLKKIVIEVNFLIAITMEYPFK
jgi:hypothetical protein